MNCSPHQLLKCPTAQTVVLCGCAQEAHSRVHARPRRSCRHWIKHVSVTDPLLWAADARHEHRPSSTANGSVPASEPPPPAPRCSFWTNVAQMAPNGVSLLVGVGTRSPRGVNAPGSVFSHAHCFMWLLSMADAGGCPTVPTLRAPTPKTQTAQHAWHPARRHTTVSEAHNCEAVKLGAHPPVLVTHPLPAPPPRPQIGS